MSKIYIAGKITGLKNYKEKFGTVEMKLNKEGHICMNPARLNLGFSWIEYMHICIAMLDVCDTIYMLENWESSMGAIEEHNYAFEQGKKIIYQGELN